ncbi:hypothetical protein M8C21_029656 [Ambrosia artemisiifolia]|uniref:Uncharacterized protein n=1 Tax=Ambrosia artemisiifolia TaxID=4212 RepID=A0AAD5DDB9_AMBAR|nr:hypothetical protein M8C21_029656 [Ambrosia artemisiifolia]
MACLETNVEEFAKYGWMNS